MTADDRDRGSDDLPEERTETVPVAHKIEKNGQETGEDVQSDPALDDRLGSDWADEGGATTAGPATSTPGGEELTEGDDPKRRARIDREREERKGREEDEGDESR